MKTSKRHLIKEKEVKKILDQLPVEMKIILPNEYFRKSKIERTEFEDHQIYLIEGQPFLIEDDMGKIFPSLSFTDILQKLPQITVDMGAIPHICNGADVMAPGITKINGIFEEKTLVVIVDEKYNKPIAIGVSIYNSEKIKLLKHGKVIKTLHYIGDSVWNYIRTLK
jgi:PUA domain protein